MRKQHQAGFTLFEAAVAGLVLAILVGIGVPQLDRSLSLYRLTASAQLVATELNAARVLAVSRNWLYEIDCNTTNNTIQVIDPNDSGNSPRTTMSLATGITFNSIPSSGSEIQFHAKGYARSGIIVLQNAEGETNSIVVIPSGKIGIHFS